MAKMMKKVDYSNKNLALTAILLVLAIVFLLLMNKGDSPAQNNFKNIIKLSDEVRNIYKTKPDYWGLNTERAVSQKITILENSYKKPTLIGQGFDGMVSMPGDRNFNIIYKNLNRHQCISMLLIKIKEQDSLGLIGISVKNSKNNIDFSWSGENSLPVEAKAAKKYCYSSNDIAWTFE